MGRSETGRTPAPDVGERLERALRTMSGSITGTAPGTDVTKLINRLLMGLGWTRMKTAELLNHLRGRQGQ